LKYLAIDHDNGASTGRIAARFDPAHITVLRENVMKSNRWNLNMTVMLALVMTAAAAGCGDVVSNQGNLGKLVYSLHTDYAVVEGSLEDVNLITGVTHRINVTPSKDAEISDPSKITHILAPSDGVTITTDETTESIGDAIFTVATAGEYTLQSWLGSTLIDYIVLNFVDAEGIDVVTFVREPEADQFVRNNETPVQVPLYSQATFIGKPVDADGNTLVGDISLDYAAVPADAVVDVFNLDAVYENGVWGSATPLNIMFVKPGNVTVVLTEQLTGLQQTLSFAITDTAVPQE